MVYRNTSVFRSPVKWREVDHAVALLKLPQLYLLTLAVGPELDFDAAVAQEGRRAAGRLLLSANLVPVHPPRLRKLVHVKFEKAVASHCVIAFVAIVVATKAAEASTQVRSGHHFHKTVAVPCDLQTCKRGHHLHTCGQVSPSRAEFCCCVLTCDGGELEQVPVQVDVHARAVVGQGDARAVPPHRQVLMEAQDQSSQPDLNRLSPGERTSPPGIIFHQNLQQMDDAGEYRIKVRVYIESNCSHEKQCTWAVLVWSTQTQRSTVSHVLPLLCGNK